MVNYGDHSLIIIKCLIQNFILLASFEFNYLREKVVIIKE